MATAATVTQPYPLDAKLGTMLDVCFLNGTMPADASGGLYWTIGWARVVHACPVCVADVTADIGPLNYVYAPTTGILTVYGHNNADTNDAVVTVMVIGNR